MCPDGGDQALLVLKFCTRSTVSGPEGIHLQSLRFTNGRPHEGRRLGKTIAETSHSKE